MDYEQIAHDLAVSFAVKRSDNTEDLVKRYFKVLDCVQKQCAAEIQKRNKSKKAIVPR